ncbi:MAG: FAD:protein FMN transferase [Campylobacterota bacterium]|nr:FAD:protein FMN transferase [Campylobacterota bacterium]
MKISIVFLYALTVLNAETMFSRTQMMMGTFAQIELPQSQSKFIQRGFERLKSVELALSSYNKNADIYRLNHALHVKLQADTYEALLKSYRYFHESNGYFNITIGSITKGLYHFGEEEQIPSPTAVKNAVVDMDGLTFDRHSAQIKEGMKIDLGGMGKGFGIDKVHELYQKEKIRNGKISLSGDIRCLGQCNISIVDPFSPNQTQKLYKTKKRGLGVTTSGNYRRFVKTKKHHHLINPKTHLQAKDIVSITLIGVLSNSDLDAYATAASVMSLQQAILFLNQFQIAYIIYTSKEEEISSANLKEFVTTLAY